MNVKDFRGIISSFLMKLCMYVCMQNAIIYSKPVGYISKMIES